MSMKAIAARSALWSAAETWGVRGVSALVFLLLARLLDADAFGVMALAGVYLMILQMLADQGFAEALIQRAELEDAHRDSAFWANVAIGLTLMLATLALAGPLARLYSAPLLEPVLQVLAVAPLLAALTVVQQALLRRELRFKALTLRQTIGSLAGGATGVGLALSGAGVWALVGQQLAGQLVALLVLWSVSAWRPGWHFSWRHFRELFSFGANVLGAGLLRIIGFQADRLLIGYVLGTTEVGYYSVAQRLLMIVSDLLSGSAERIVLPLFARLQHDRERVRRGLFTAGRILSLAAFPCFAGLAATAPLVIDVGLGPQWRPALLATQLLVPMSLCFSLSFFFAPLLTALGRPSWRLAVVALHATLNVAAIWAGVTFGIAGVALALSLVQLVMYFVELGLLRRLVEFDLLAYLQLALAPLLAAAAMAALVVALQLWLWPWLAGWAVLAIAVAAGAGLYVGVIAAIAPSRLREIIDLARGLRPSPAPRERVASDSEPGEGVAGDG
jgi:PST family polysaccharide transporter